MPANRFEQVDEPPSDAMTLSLNRDGDKHWGVVTCPARTTNGLLPKDFSSDEMPLKDAIRSAIRLANEMKVPLVVVDPEALWVAEWGTLYRDQMDVDAADQS